MPIKRKKNIRILILFLILWSIISNLTLDVRAKILNSNMLFFNRLEVINENVKENSVNIDALSGLGMKHNGLYVKFINVGDGDSIYIELPNGDDVLIDGGDYNTTKQLIEFLKTQDLDEGDGINDIEYVINTHPHSDHTAGLVEVLKEFKVNNLYYPYDIEMKEYEGFEGSNRLVDGYKVNCMNYCYQFYSQMLKEAKRQKTKIHDTITGDYIDSSNILRFVHPNKTYKQNYLDKEKSQITSLDYCMFNNDSAVILLNYNDLNILFAGDIEQEAEYDIIREGVVGFKDIDILKVSHHGYDGSSTKEFIDYLGARMAIITRNNYYDTSAIRNLEEKNIMILETWQNNGVELMPNEKGWYIK